MTREIVLTMFQKLKPRESPAFVSEMMADLAENHLNLVAPKT